MKNKKGFTLLELLVVVLIIGIRAAIALPQYRVAVTKTKIAGMFPLMRAWQDAADMYYVQYGEFPPTDTEPELDVSWPSDWVEFVTDEPCENSYNCHGEEFHCWCSNDGAVTCEHLATKTGIVMYSSNREEDDKGQFMCYSGKGGEIAEKICRALGGKETENEGEFSLK